MSEAKKELTRANNAIQKALNSVEVKSKTSKSSSAGSKKPKNVAEAGGI